MRNTQESWNGLVSNQKLPHLPMLYSSAELTVVPSSRTTEDDGDRSKRLFGRDVRLSVCGGPCVSMGIIDMAFDDAAVAQ
jgi:hypothetical protein